MTIEYRDKILEGNCLETLKKLPDESIDCIVTSPPYWGLRNYGTATWEGGDPKCTHEKAKIKSRYDYSLSENSIQDVDRVGSDAPRYKDECPTCGAKKVDFQLGLEPTFEEYIDKLCTLFDEGKRALKKHGTCWVNLGDTYNSTQAGNIKPTGFQQRTPEEREAKALFKRTKADLPDKCLLQIPFRFSIEMCNRGWILRNVIIWHKPNCMPTSVEDRFTVDFEYVFFFVKERKYYFEQQLEKTKTPGSVQVSKEGDKSSLIKDTVNATYFDRDYITGDMKNKRAVWTISPKPFKGAHFATYPFELIEPMVKAGCPRYVCKKCGKPREKVNEKEFSDCGCKAGFEAGIVLDPFMGSGTTAVMAKKLHRDYVGLELNPEYIKMANKRIKNATAQGELFEFPE